MTCPLVLSDASFLTLGAESTWATVPGSPTYVHVPVSEYNVRLQNEFRQSELYTGIHYPKHSQKRRGSAVGSLTAPLFGWVPSSLSVSLAQYLVDWAFEIPGVGSLSGLSDFCSRPSKFAEWAEGPDIANKRHTGLRAMGATLRGDASSGQVTLQVNLQGKDEATFSTAQSVPDDMEGLYDFSFEDSVLTLGGSAAGMEAFELSVQYKPVIKYENAKRPVHVLVGAVAEYTFNVTINKEDDTYPALNRAAADSELSGSLVVKGTHNGTGTSGTEDTVLTIAMPRMNLQDVEDSYSFGDSVTESLPFRLLKPDTSALPMGLTWSEA